MASWHEVALGPSKLRRTKLVLVLALTPLLLLAALAGFLIYGARQLTRKWFEFVTS